MALKWLRDNLRHLKFILWGVVLVFVLLVFVDWGAGRAGGGGGGKAAVRVGNRSISETEFLDEMRRLDQRFSQIYGEQWNELRGQVDLATSDCELCSSIANSNSPKPGESVSRFPGKSSKK